MADGSAMRARSQPGDGLLQRLRGHRMMVALASGAADLSKFSAAADTVKVAPLVQEILDAAVQRD